MKRLFAISCILVLCAVPLMAQSITGSKHDLRLTGGGTPVGTNLTEICVVCHTPHQVTAANKQDPLWNRTLSSTGTYGVYASDTLDATPTELGGATIGTASVSNLCLSCHDGTVSVLAMLNPPNGVTSPNAITAAGNILADGTITGTASTNVGTDLTDDHPVNFTFDAALRTLDGGLNDPTALTGVKLFGGTVQCASCHNPHDSANTPFLRVSNSGSGLCLKCHNK